MNYAIWFSIGKLLQCGELFWEIVFAGLLLLFYRFKGSPFEAFGEVILFTVLTLTLCKKINRLEVSFSRCL